MALVSMLDLLREGLLLLDPRGRLIHMNRAAVVVLEGAGYDGAQVLRSISKFIYRLKAANRERRATGTAVDELEVGELEIDRDRYLLRGIRIRLGHFRRGFLLVVLEQISSLLLSYEQLQQQYRLTHREAEVARLIAQGQANIEVAKALCISPHTARHHTERVLNKLGVCSRAQVAAKVRGSNPAPPVQPAEAQSLTASLLLRYKATSDPRAPRS